MNNGAAGGDGSAKSKMDWAGGVHAEVIVADTQKKSSNFMIQGAILGAASIVVRLIGLVYRVPLNNILGAEGIAYYGVAFDVYSILLLLSSYSMPLAVSKMVSARVALGQYRNVRKVLIHAIFFSLLLGLAAFAITFFGAQIFANILNYPQSAMALKVLSPALVILSVLGVLRGYFQGYGNMVPTALSNIFEQIVNAVVSIVASTVLFNLASTAAAGNNTPSAMGAAGGTLGTVMGAFTALVFMIILVIAGNKKLNRRIAEDTTRVTDTTGQIMKVMVLTILPVILSTTIYNISSLLDTGIFGNLMMYSGLDQSTITAMNGMTVPWTELTTEVKQQLIAILTGMYTGNYRLLINVPIALASALASSLIPSVVASMAQKNHSQVIRKIESSVKLTMLIAFPCAVGIGVLSKPIISVLFSSCADIDKVSLMLMIGCISIVLYSLSTITNSILQGIDKMRIPVIHSAISLVIHIIFLAAAMMLTQFNIFCVVVADVLFALLMCILNHRSIKKYLDYKQEVKKTFLLPLISSVIMGAAAFGIYTLIHKLLHSNLIALIAAIIAAVIVYAVMLLLLRVIEQEELEMLPMGGKLARTAKKLHLMR